MCNTNHTLMLTCFVYYQMLCHSVFVYLWLSGSQQNTFSLVNEQIQYVRALLSENSSDILLFPALQSNKLFYAC